MYPTSFRYSKEHEWVAREGESCTIGITEFAQNELGDIVYVELPGIGTEVRVGDVMGTVESVKAVSEIYAPISGKVVEINKSLDDEPETVNRDPHGEGWFCKMRLRDPKELEALMDAAAYQEFVGS